MLEYERLRRELLTLSKSYREKYPECVPIYASTMFQPEPVARPYLETLCNQSFYKGYEMAISYSRAVREFEWPFEKAWQGLANLYGTAQHHLDSFVKKAAINAHIRGYCFSNGLEKSFKLNYEIILKNGIPTHLYDTRNQQTDRLKNLLSIDNVLREKLGMDQQDSDVIGKFQLRVQTEREALRNVQDTRFSAKDKEVEVPLIPKNPENLKVIISKGPPEVEEGILEKNTESKKVVEIMGDDQLDTGAKDVQLVNAEGDAPGEQVEATEAGDAQADQVQPENPEEPGLNEDEIPEEPETEEVIEEDVEPEEVPLEEEPVMLEDEEAVPNESNEEVPETEEVEEEVLDEEPVEEAEPASEEQEVPEEVEQEGLNDAGINDDGDVSIDPDLTETDPDLDELNEFD